MRLPHGLVLLDLHLASASYLRRQPVQFATRSLDLDDVRDTQGVLLERLSRSS